MAYKTKNNTGRILNMNKETNYLNSTSVVYTNFMSGLSLYLYWTSGQAIPNQV